MMGSMAAFTVNDTNVKLLGGSLDLFQIIALRVAPTSVRAFKLLHSDNLDGRAFDNDSEALADRLKRGDSPVGYPLMSLVSGGAIYPCAYNRLAKALWLPHSGLSLVQRS